MLYGQELGAQMVTFWSYRFERIPYISKESCNIGSHFIAWGSSHHRLCCWQLLDCVAASKDMLQHVRINTLEVGWRKLQLPQRGKNNNNNHSFCSCIFKMQWSRIDCLIDWLIISRVWKSAFRGTSWDRKRSSRSCTCGARRVIRSTASGGGISSKRSRRKRASPLGSLA